MRRVRFSVATSLDGYIAGPGDESDWIVVDPEIDFGELFAGFDTVLMGRRSYEKAREQGSVEDLMPGMDVHVFSRTLRQEDCPDATLSRDPAATVAEIRESPGEDLWLFGGGSLFASFLELGLVDSIELAVVPVLLGHGVPLLPAPAERVGLRLVEHRVYETTGTVMLTYVRRGSGSKDGRARR